MNTLIPISIKVVICWLFAGWSVQYLLGIRHNYRQLCWLFAGCFLTVARGGCIIRTAADSPTGGQRMPIGGNRHRGHGRQNPDRWRCAVAVSPQSVPARQSVAHCGCHNLPAGGVCCPWWVHHQNRSR